MIADTKKIEQQAVIAEVSVETIKDFNTILTEFSTIIKELETTSNKDFLNQFMTLVVFIATDLHKALRAQDDEFKPAMAGILQDAMGKVSKKFTTGGIQPNEIKEKVLPLLLEAVQYIASPVMNVEQIRNHLEKWAILGIHIA